MKAKDLEITDIAIVQDHEKDHTIVTKTDEGLRYFNKNGSLTNYTIVSGNEIEVVKIGSQKDYNDEVMKRIKIICRISGVLFAFNPDNVDSCKHYDGYSAYIYNHKLNTVELLEEYFINLNWPPTIFDPLIKKLIKNNSIDNDQINMGVEELSQKLCINADYIRLHVFGGNL